LAWRLSAFLESRIYAISDLIHCDSAYSLIFVRREYPRAMRDKGLVLPGWVNTTQFTPAEDTPQEVRRKLGAPWDASIPTFFTLRRLVPRMGLSSLLAAAALLAGEGHAFRLVIGGAGPQLESLRSRARDLGVADHVSFLGFVPEHELADCFRAADCFVLPTQSLECFGLIILEAYACGVPVIGVPVGSIPEVVGPEFGHWQALDNSAEGLAERMRDFIMGKLRPDPAALRHRAMQFGFEAMAARHEQVLLNNVGVADICGIGMLS
jgi:glycosyltransferase involved in cell wall biosynthesis